jgi:peptidyl-prolyl cis-trans isomerase SurA
MTTMTTARLPTRCHSLVLSSLLALFLLLGGGARLHAQTIAVMVNGEPITNFDIEQRGKLNFLTTHKPPVRQEVINELIDEKVKIKEGKKFSIEPTAADVDQSFAAMGTRLRLTPEQLVKSLESQGIRPDTLKSRIKAEMVWNNLVRGRYKESLQVGEKDVAAAVKDSGEEKLDTAGLEYKMQPVVLILPRGSEPAAIETRRKDAEALRNRIQTCDEANALFKSLPNTAIKDAVTKTSADIPPALREVLDNVPIGHLTPPEVTKQGVEMVVLCDRKPTTVDTPKKKEIRDKMFAEKYEAKSKSYLQEVRKAAMIEYR